MTAVDLPFERRSQPIGTAHESVGPTAVAQTGPARGERGPQRSRGKAFIDRTLAVLALILLIPVLALIALAVRLDSPGAAVFRQVRVGQGCRRFTMYKFRTMHAGAEQLQDDLAALNIHEGGTLFKIPADPRITRVGAFLRRFSLDELPQLVNIARGEMSLVGPRPPVPAEVRLYPPDAFRRFIVRPGLTGLWQVGGRSKLDEAESARLDMHYVEHWSPWLDARIVARTVGVVLSGEGAY